jgi:magnesium-transporting ATPase (P-type)
LFLTATPNAQFQVDEPPQHNTLVIPSFASDASFDSLAPSPSYDGGETLQPTPSNGGSWASSSQTHLPHGEAESLLHAEMQNEHDGLFAFSTEMLTSMFGPKDVATFVALGGISGLQKGLRTDLQAGLSQDETAILQSPSGPGPPPQPGHFAERIAAFGGNRTLKRKEKSLLQLMWITLNDKVLILLSVIAIISLSLGLYQTFGQPHEPGQPRVEWVEGVTIMTAVIIVVVVGAVNDYQKERQFAKLNAKVVGLLFAINNN